MQKLLELPHSDCIHQCFFPLYNCSYLFIGSSILPFHCQKIRLLQLISNASSLFHPLYLQSMFLLHKVAREKTIVIWSWSLTSIIIPLSFHVDCNSLYTAVARVILLRMSLEQSLSHVNSLPRYIKLLTFSIACPSIFALALFSYGFFSKDCGLFFTTFICIPYHSLSVCYLSTESCNFTLLCSIISMSSANLRLFTRLPWTLSPLFSLFLISSIILSRNKANDRGDNGSPCLLPTVIWNHSLRCPLTNTANCVSL